MSLFQPDTKDAPGIDKSGVAPIGNSSSDDGKSRRIIKVSNYEPRKLLVYLRLIIGSRLG
jgi:hypothetical protein